MRRLLACLFLLAPSLAFGQALVQQSGSRLDAASAVAYQQSAVNASSVATITVPSGQYCYITGISIDFANDATGTSPVYNSQVTSTNLAGSPTWGISVSTTANGTNVPIREWFPVPLKGAAPGTNCVVTSPASLTHTQATVRVYYYLAP